MLKLFTLLNVIFVAALYHAERNVAESRWLATFITYAPQHFSILPSLFLILCALVFRRWRMFLLNSFLAVFCLFSFLGYHARFHAAPENSGATLRVLTYNIHHGSKGASEIAKIIHEKKPDVACLQEANAYKSWRDPMPEIRKQFKGWHIVQASDLAILSRETMVSTKIYHFPIKTRRVILEGIINFKETKLAIFNVHFATAIGPQWLLNSRESLDDYLEQTASVREIQFKTLMSVTSKTRAVLPVIIAGDFNTPPRGKFYRSIKQNYHDAFHEAGQGFGYTFRSDMPLLRIDYVFLDKRLKAAKASVVDITASDHRPLVAEVMIAR